MLVDRAATSIILEGCLVLLYAVLLLASARIVVAALAAAIGLGIIAIGWGFRGLRPWGRVGAIVISAVGLLGIPLGTIVWGLVLVYLFKPEVRLVFAGGPLSPGELARARDARDLWKPFAVVLGVLNILLILALGLVAIAVVAPKLMR